MSDSDLNKFVENVVRINADYAGMGGASAAIIGAAGTNNSIIADMRRNVFAFAAEYSKPVADKSTLEQLAQQLQGSFLTLKMVDAISISRLDELNDNLEAILQRRAS